MNPLKTSWRIVMKVLPIYQLIVYIPPVLLHQVKILLRNPFDLKSKKRIFNTNSFPKKSLNQHKDFKHSKKKRSTKSFRTSKLEINENSQQEKTDQRTFCYERNYISLVFQDICVSRDFLII